MVADRLDLGFVRFTSRVRVKLDDDLIGKEEIDEMRAEHEREKKEKRAG